MSARPLSRSVPVLGCVLLTGCAILHEDPDPKVQTGLEVADKFVHRGMPQNRNWVAQGNLDTTFTTRWNDKLTLSSFANMDLKSSTGTAWFPSGHGGRVSQFELTGTYAKSFDYGLDIAFGLQNYNVPFGESFPFGARDSTNELFFTAATEFLGARPLFEIRHDIDQGGGTYARLGVSEPFPLDEAETWTIDLSGHVAYSSKAMSFWNYGIENAGVADLKASAALLYVYDQNTILGTEISASTILDDGISDWFDQLGIESDNLWIRFFAKWSY